MGGNGSKMRGNLDNSATREFKEVFFISNNIKVVQLKIIKNESGFQKKATHQTGFMSFSTRTAHSNPSVNMVLTASKI